jgi:hypothetical protein
VNVNGFMYLDVNPEPWAVGPLSIGKRNGKMFPKMERNASVHAFKEAVRDEVAGQVQMLPPGEYDLEFYLWRRLDSYIGETGRKINAHVADATNMQKALEDALQGLVIDNDRGVRRIKTEIVEQGPDVIPGIGFLAKSYEVATIPDAVVSARSWAVARAGTSRTSDNSWPPS